MKDVDRKETRMAINKLNADSRTAAYVGIDNAPKGAFKNE